MQKQLLQLLKQQKTNFKQLQKSSTYNFSKDVIYTFDKSICKYGLNFYDFDQLSLENIQWLSEMGINRYFYNMSQPQQIQDFLSEKRNDQVKFLLEQNIFSGYTMYLPFLTPNDKFIKTDEVQTFLKALGQFQQISNKANIKSKKKFRIFTGISQENKIQNLGFFEEIIQNCFENYSNLLSIVKSTFDIELIFLSRNKNPWGNLWQRDNFFNLFQQHQVGMNLNLIKSLEVQDDKKQMMKELYMYIYDNSEHLKAVFVKDYEFNEELNQFKRCELGKGLMSFTHLTDIMKLKTFEGFIMFDQRKDNKLLEKEILFFNNLLQEQSFSKTEMETYKNKMENSDNNVSAFLDY